MHSACISIDIIVLSLVISAISMYFNMILKLFTMIVIVSEKNVHKPTKDLETDKIFMHIDRMKRKHVENSKNVIRFVVVHARWPQ